LFFKAVMIAFTAVAISVPVALFVIAVIAAAWATGVAP
jgi:hypothetical protein